MKNKWIFFLLFVLVFSACGGPGASSSPDMQNTPVTNQSSVAILIIDDFTNSQNKPKILSTKDPNANCVVTPIGQAKFGATGTSGQALEAPHGDVVYGEVRKLVLDTLGEAAISGDVGGRGHPARRVPDRTRAARAHRHRRAGRGRRGARLNAAGANAA